MALTRIAASTPTAEPLHENSTEDNTQTALVQHQPDRINTTKTKSKDGDEDEDEDDEYDEDQDVVQTLERSNATLLEKKKRRKKRKKPTDKVGSAALLPAPTEDRGAAPGVAAAAAAAAAGGVDAAADLAAAAQELTALVSTAAELLPPFGVLRTTITSQPELAQLQAAVTDAITLLSTDLNTAADKLGLKTRGKLFQALVLHAQCSIVDGILQPPLLSDRTIAGLKPTCV
jgi:hypothetical protein